MLEKIDLASISCVLAAIGLSLNLAAQIINNRTLRSKLVTGHLRKFSDDAQMLEVFYKIDYEKFQYDEKTFPESDLEIKTDKLLRHFSNLALFWKNGILKKNDLLPVKYYIDRIVSNPEIGRYFEFIEDWCEKKKIEQHPYFDLKKLHSKLLKS